MNFLRDAVRFFFRRGDIDQAEYWFSQLRNWEGINYNDTTVTHEFSLTLEEFADKMIYDSMGSPQVAVSEVDGALQGAFYQGLLAGDIDTFNGMWEYARKAHAAFFNEQFRNVVAGTNTARMEFMDRDFPFHAGNTFANTVARLPFDEAELLYGNAPKDLQRYAYDTLVIRFKAFIDEQHKLGNIDVNFAQAFPEPEGMERHREIYKIKMDQREENSVEGVIKD
jgi:hypothetical protein